MSARNQARRLRPRAERASHLVPPAIAVFEAVEAPQPVPASPIAVTIETPEENEARTRLEAAARLPLSIRMARPRPYTPAIPIAELRAWCELYQPALWDRLQLLEQPKPRRRRV